MQAVADARIPAALTEPSVRYYCAVHVPVVNSVPYYMSTVVLALRAHRIQGTIRENGNFPRVLLGTLSGHI